VDPTTPAVAIAGAPGANVSIELGLHGETMTFSTGCSSSTNAIGQAFRRIGCGMGTVALAGGSDTALQYDVLAAYAEGNALSTRNGQPQRACRPFDANRDGHVLSDAAGILVLEEYEHARARGAEVVAEIAGYGTSSDGHSMFSVDENVKRAARSVSRAMQEARVNKDDIDYYCAHGSASRASDARETRMLKEVLGEDAYDVPASSIKSMVGHPFGASGALQAATCALAIKHGVVPPTINYEDTDPECDLDYVPNEARGSQVGAALTYALGAGGNNAALVLTAP
jgi:3-oxoacyl-[acyl-carrier-protein] synthase II